MFHITTASWRNPFGTNNLFSTFCVCAKFNIPLGRSIACCMHLPIFLQHLQKLSTFCLAVETRILKVRQEKRMLLRKMIRYYFPCDSSHSVCSHTVCCPAGDQRYGWKCWLQPAELSLEPSASQPPGPFAGDRHPAQHAPVPEIQKHKDYVRQLHVSKRKNIKNSYNKS